MAGFEPATSSLPRKCSTPELHWQLCLLSGRRGSNPRPSAWKADALPSELLPQLSLWAKMDSNHRRYKPADLQSAPFGLSGIRPKYLKDSFRSSLRLFSQGRVSSHSSQASFRSLNVLFRASCRIRTNDPEITNHVLWPTELKRRSLSRLVATGVVPKSDAKLWLFSLPTKPFANFFVRKFHRFSLTFSLPDN